jgi:hypothetical protein
MTVETDNVQFKKKNKEHESQYSNEV